MPFVKGWLRVLSRGEADNELPELDRPTDPGYGFEQGGSIDNSLPPGVPPIGSTLPEPPPGTWPPPSFTRPVVPALPIAPPSGGTKPVEPVPPGTIWPPVGGMQPQKFWVVAGIPGIGWRYICVDPSLTIDVSPPQAVGRPDAGLPDTASPRR